MARNLENLEALAALEPHTRDIIAVAQRETGTQPQPFSDFVADVRQDYRTADYVARVDGDDYVVSFSDCKMSRESVACISAIAAESPVFATDTERSQQWLTRNNRLRLITPHLRPIFTGQVQVCPRDAFDVNAGFDEMLSRGMVGYTLRRGEQAILHATGDLPEDPDFFLRAIQAAKTNDPIDRKTHFTENEKQRHIDIYRPIIGKLRYLVVRDGLAAEEAYNQYTGKTGETGLGMSVAKRLYLNTQLDTDVEIRSATYNPYEGVHVLVSQYGKGLLAPITAHVETVVDGETTERYYRQTVSHPDVLVADPPNGAFAESSSVPHRLFMLSDTDTLDLNALIAAL